MPEKRKICKSVDGMIDLTDKIKLKSGHQSSPEYSPYLSQNFTNRSINQRSPSPIPSTSSQPIVASASRGKKRAWTKEEDQALLDSIIVELSGHWSSICSRNELLTQRGPKTGNENGRDKRRLRVKE
ncbi:hypothetical protein GLOIN_2v1575668 [Rhizophagus clarus]|uniref:Myb-like domain-containing protein n=1 Tax=Rhizophagus clarus TaxID=94130 RepID=A0A8H3LIT4_9GLOM|nr:hypothetical protein GLOIN_2v1575668 [Rhizophagus clarus]